MGGVSEPVLQVLDLKKHFPVGSQVTGRGGTVYAVDGVSFAIGQGEMLGLVGESGSGKTTVGNCIMRLLEPTDGTILLKGRDITHLSRREIRPLRREMHMVFQDPYSSLDPRMTCGQIVGEPLRTQRLARGAQLENRIRELFDAVGLRPELRYRYPHELSGGQRQRVGLARALSVSPSLLIADEPVSALDVSVQAAILNLMRDLQQDMHFSCLFITHDLATVEYLCDRVAVMYLGEIVERAPSAELYANPRHPYTRALLQSTLVPDPDASREEIVLSGEPPSAARPPAGCRFHTRCPFVMDICRNVAPRAVETDPGHAVACHLYPATPVSKDCAPNRASTENISVINTRR
jgi:oligopeptide transport system ATP-binding protein